MAQLDLEPADATVWIDGRAAPDPAAALTPGRHTLVVTAPGYFGEFRQLDVDPGERHAVALTRLDLPSFAEFSEFSAAFDPDARPSAAPPTFRHRPYRQLVRMKQLRRREGAEGIRADVRRLEALADAGDAPAQLMLFLAVDGKLVDEPLDRRLPGLRRASAAGYGLATYYYALYFRWERETAGGLDRESLEELRDLFALAAKQGLAFANAAVKEADELLAAP